MLDHQSHEIQNYQPIVPLVLKLGYLLEGRTVASFQEYFPGFLNHKENKVVKVLSLENINGIDLLEAEVSHCGTEIYRLSHSIFL